MNNEPASTQYWCLGVAAKRVRPLAHLEAEAGWRLRQRAVRIVLFGPVLTLLVPLSLGLAWLSLGLWPPVGLALLGLSPISWGGGILVALDQFRRKRVLDRETRDPVAAEFETVLTEDDTEIAVALGVSAEPGAAFRFAVVLASGRVLSIQGLTVPKFVILDSQVVARAPADSTGGSAGSRQLSGDEIQEIHRLATSSWRSPLRDRAAYVLFGLVAAWRGPDLYRSGWWHALPAAAFASLAAIGIAACVRDVARARRLEVDARRGLVNVESVAGTPRIILEVLPGANEIWTVDGDPAVWRTASRTRRL